MANTLTDLIPDIQVALDTVSREFVGFIGAVARDSGAERAALNQTVRSFETSEGSTGDNTPALEVPDTGDETVGNKTLTISKSKHYPVRWTGEEELGLSNAGTLSAMSQDRFAQGMRSLVNEIEADLASLYVSASRAFGTAATAPFNTADSMLDFAGVKRILDENGAPPSDRQLVLGHAAINNLIGKQTGLFHVNEAGTSDILRMGMTRLPLYGFQIRHTGQVAAHTKGTATGFDADGGEPAGETVVAVDGSDSGTILSGDVVTWVGDSNKYVVASATASGAADGNITLNAPGLRQSLATTVEGTIGGTYTANLAFHRNAIHLATRAPAMGNDKAVDRTIVQDPVSGLAFEVAEYPGFGQRVFHVRIAWGFAAIKPQHMAILLG